MKLYKLTDADGYTQRGQVGETLWSPGFNLTIEGLPVPCTGTVIHAYKTPIEAVLFNPFHARISNPRLWLAKGEIIGTDGLKVWTQSLTIRHELTLPRISTRERIAFAILATLKVYTDSTFKKWANKWLSGIDRSAWAAEAMARIARVAEAGEVVGAAEAAWTAEVATRAARVIAVKVTTRAAWVADVGTRAARVADMAEAARTAEVAEMAARVARVAQATGVNLNFTRIFKQAQKRLKRGT